MIGVVELIKLIEDLVVLFDADRVGAYGVFGEFGEGELVALGTAGENSFGFT